jgi:DNA-binding NarL/FixJ family response regulator
VLEIHQSFRVNENAHSTQRSNAMVGGMAREVPMNMMSETVQATVAVTAPSPLTPREMDVLRLMADGLTTREIGSQLGMKFKTAACHRNRILQKLSVKSTVSAVRWAFRAGLIEV